MRGFYLISLCKCGALRPSFALSPALQGFRSDDLRLCTSTTMLCIITESFPSAHDKATLFRFDMLWGDFMAFSNQNEGLRLALVAVPLR